jgi:hypothetical protein
MARSISPTALRPVWEQDVVVRIDASIGPSVGIFRKKPGERTFLELVGITQALLRQAHDARGRQL